MMAQNDLVVVGIDIAKDKVDACIRSLSLRVTWPSTAEGRRKLIAWRRKHKAGKAAMEASGGYERDWARALREAGIEVRIIDPKRTDIESNHLSPRLFSVWLTGARNLSAVMFPHSIRRKNIAEHRPNNHPRYRHPIRQLEQRLCYERCKHSSQPHKCSA